MADDVTPLYRLGEFFRASGRALERKDLSGEYVIVGFLDPRIADEVLGLLNRRKDC